MCGELTQISRPLSRCLGNFAPLHRTHHIFACAWNLGISKHGMSAVMWSELFHLHYGNVETYDLTKEKIPVKIDEGPMDS